MKMSDSENQQTIEEALSFEEGIQELENIISKLELGEISLEDSFTLYQRGVTLSKMCSKQLQNMEKKIQIISLDTQEE